MILTHDCTLFVGSVGLHRQEIFCVNGAQKFWNEGEGTKTKYQTCCHFVANAYVELYAFYTEKSDLLKKFRGQKGVTTATGPFPLNLPLIEREQLDNLLNRSMIVEVSRIATLVGVGFVFGTFRAGTNFRCLFGLSYYCV